MSNYSSLKSAIDANIKANGRREITGPVLNAILNAVVNSLGDGYLFKGVAIPSTNPGTPDQNVAYLAITEGTYTHMGGLSVTDGELSVFSYNGAWSKIPLALVPTKTSQLDNDLGFVTSEEMGEGLSLKQDTIQDLSEIRSGAALGATAYQKPSSGIPSSDMTDTVQQAISFAESTEKRSYNSSNPDGMGYLVLKKNKTFAEQVTEENTIYEIRYDFDLNNATVNIPSGCVLRFNGGKLLNGTLNIGAGVSVDSDDVKIFNGITFTGAVNSQYFHLDWFVENYTDTISMSSPDATNEIQAMFNSGIKKIWLTNKHHYKITQTIVVDATISIDGVMQQNAHNSNSKYWFGNIASPLVKLLPIGRVNNVLVNNLYLYRVMDSDTVNFDNDYRKDIATFYVDCTQGDILGVKANIIIDYSEFKTILYPLDGTTQIETWAMGYRGIEVYCANNHWITFADFSGSIWGHYEGIKVHKDSSSSWITGITVNFDSLCVYGGIIQGEVVLNGKHQTNAKLPYNDRGYFEVSSTCIIKDCQIWDASQGRTKSNTTLFTTYYSVKAAEIWGGEELIDAYSDNARNIKNNWLYPVSGNAQIGANILPAAFFMVSQGKSLSNSRTPFNAITFKYFTNDADYESFIGGDRTKGIALSTSNVNGFENLFCPDQLFADNATTRTTKESRKATINDSVKVLFLGIGASYLKNATIVVATPFSSSIASITIDNGSGNPIVFNSGLKDRYKPIFVPLIGAAYRWQDYTGEIRVTIKYTSAVTNYAVPYIGLCTMGYGDLIGPSGGYVYGNLELNSCTVKEIDIKGIKNNAGTFADKPSSPYIGFRYFCTDRQTAEGQTDGIDIIYKGNSVWVDALGRVVS